MKSEIFFSLRGFPPPQPQKKRIDTKKSLLLFSLIDSVLLQVRTKPQEFCLNCKLSNTSYNLIVVSTSYTNYLSKNLILCIILCICDFYLS